VKKEARPNMVPPIVEMARLLHDNWMPYNLRDVHLPGGGWELSSGRVPFPPVPPRDPEQTMEIQCRWSYVPVDLRANPAYAIDSDRWLN
jgi:hypothetical protein